MSSNNKSYYTKKINTDDYKIFNNEKYDVAESAYKEVIKNSLAKDKIENAHIQILKISRLAGDYRIVERKIPIVGVVFAIIVRLCSLFH